MIKTVIKSNGTKEDFCPHKINGWGEWASKTLNGLVDWSDVVLQTVSKLPEECSSNVLQDELIRTCLDMNSWSYNRMAGRLYVKKYRKEVFGKGIPTVKSVHKSLVSAGLMKGLKYTSDDYLYIEELIDHERDLNNPHFSLQYIRQKYALQGRSGVRTEHETPQFTYMRMASALAESQPLDRRMDDLKEWYDIFSLKKGCAPTPNYINLGTLLNGYASCCAIASGDDLNSLAIGDYIATVMTGQSAGIGDKKSTRSLGEAVRGGAVSHQGKLPYYRVLQSAVGANVQAGRGGAATTYFECYDPEVKALMILKNPMTTQDSKIDGIDYAMQSNKFFARKVAKNEDVFLFNVKTAPDLVQAMYLPDDGVTFAKLYEEYERDTSFIKNYVNARDVRIKWSTEAFETNRAYDMFTDEVNRHTPHKEAIIQSNLCLELAQPTTPYYSMLDLLSEEDHGRGEVSMCSLGAINVAEVLTDEEYEKVAYYILLMIDKCIHLSDYPLTHIGVTAKARMNAGVGVTGLAQLMAQKGLSYNSQEGRDYINYVFERHSYFCIKASLRLGKELGNAKWMHKTKWPEGWLPIDTYNKNVDNLTSNKTNYDWEGLRHEIISNGGIRNSSVVNHMPGESNSKAVGTTNSVYRVRDTTLNKTDDETSIYWSAPLSDSIDYERVWDSSPMEQINTYAIIQKWTDAAISADMFKRLPLGTKVTSSEMISTYLYQVKMGMKTRYYMNTNDEIPEVCDGCST